MASSIEREIDEIKTLILSDKSLAYTSLIHLQRNSAGNNSQMKILSLSSLPLLPSLLSDIYHQEEEIAAQALKCLGFMLYHPLLVSSIPEGTSLSALDSLARLIVTTKMKAICNLGVWCVSVQQLNVFSIECCIDTLLGAVQYAIDNPFGSLSTTFEAIQAVMKIGTQLPNKLREIANIWLPPIYRRLISNDKKERDIAERCLMKMKSIICPPVPALSKAVADDLKTNLLARIMDKQYNCHMKTFIIQAWGWYVCLLGPSLLNNRQLINQMLKIPEPTFTDVDPQVQIASLVAWERLIDAFLPPEIITVQQRSNDELDKDFLKRIKILMVPLQGIISKKCDVLVHMSCLNTWHYLLHKLDLLVDHPLVLQITFKPIIEVIFSKKPCNANICLWKPCLDLFDQYLSGMTKSKGMDLIPTWSPCDVTKGNGIPVSYFSSRFPWIHSIKWLPWKVSNLDFTLLIIRTIISHSLTTQRGPEIRTFALSSALRIFRSVIQGVKAETKRPSVPCDINQLCLNTILEFIKECCEDISSRNDWNHSLDLLWMVFQFVDVVREELEFLVASPLYPVALDLMYIKDGKSSIVTCCPFFQAMGEGSVGYMDMVSPMIYMAFLLLGMLAQFILHLPEMDGIPLAIQNKFLFFFNPSVNLDTTVCFLYVHLSKPLNAKMSSLVIWRIIAKSLIKNVDKVFDLSILRVEGSDTKHAILYCFICYPFLTLCPKYVDVDCSRLSLVSSQRDLLLETLVEVWSTIFGYLNFESNACNQFSNGLCELLIKMLDESKNWQHNSSENSQNTDYFLLFSEMLICILVHIKPLDIEGLKAASAGGAEVHFKAIKNILILIGRFLEISLMILKLNQQCGLVMIGRVFDATIRLVGNLCLKQDVLLLLEVISNPLAQWFSFCDPLSNGERRNADHLLHCLWANILACLQRCHPIIIFDSSLLRSQALLLRAAVDHSHPPISNAAIEMWKATFGKRRHLEYPECLLPVLHKLSGSRIWTEEPQIIT